MCGSSVSKLFSGAVATGGHGATSQRKRGWFDPWVTKQIEVDQYKTDQTDPEGEDTAAHASPTFWRTRTPKIEPTKAMTSHIQP